MCGLYGSITHKNANLTPEQIKQKQSILRGLAIAMQSRGTDSAGIGAICNDKECVFKIAMEAKSMVDHKDYKKILDQNPQIVIGHTRWKTVGDIVDKNAHPFKFGNILGSHNGSVSNWKDIYPKGEVDSEAIFYELNKDKNNFTKTFPKLRGRFAITWVDLRQPDKLFLVKEDNPLFITRVPELQTYFYCSEELALESIIGAVIGIGKWETWTPKKEFVYSIDTSFKINKTKVEFASYTSSYSTSGTHQQKPTLKNDFYDDDSFEDEYFSYYKASKKDLKEYEVFDINDKSPMDFTYPEMLKVYKALFSDACYLCNFVIVPEQDGGFWWFEERGIIVCEDCEFKTDMISESSDGIWIDLDSWEDIQNQVEEVQEAEAEAENAFGGLSNKKKLATALQKIYDNGN